MERVTLLGRILDRLQRRTPIAPERARPAPVTAGGRILITGAGGGVASLIRPILAQRYARVRLTDRNLVACVASNEEFVRADLEDAVAIDAAVNGVNGIVHLGGVAKEDAIEALIPANIIGMSNILEAARKHGVRRFVFASTMHIMGFYSRNERFHEASPPRPDSRYAATKVFGEALAQVHANKHGIAIACIRIGHATADPADAEPGNWIGPADLARLIQVGLEHPDIGFEIFHAVAPSLGERIGSRRAGAFGYRHRQSDSRNVAASADTWFGRNGVARWFRGGFFAAAEHDDGAPEARS